MTTPDPPGYLIRRGTGAVYVGTLDKRAVFGYNRPALFATLAEAKKRLAGLRADHPEGEYTIEAVA